MANFAPGLWTPGTPRIPVTLYEITIGRFIMDFCYVCNSKISKENESSEHVILNSIGGRLKSKKLLCKKCNSEFGDDIDVELSKQLNYIANMLNIKRDRGEPQPFIVETKEGNVKYKYMPGGKPEIKDPTVERKAMKDGKVQYYIEARNYDEANRILNGIANKNPNIDVEKIIEKTEKRREYIEDKLHFKFDIGGDKSFRSICKSAVNFYILKGGIRDYIFHLIPYIKEGVGETPLWYYYPDENIIPKDKKQVLHSLIVKGNKQDKILYSYIEFFNVYKFIVILNNNYEGRNIEFSYFYDILNQEEINKNYRIDISKKSIKTTIRDKNIPIDKIKNQYNKILKIISEQQNSKHIKEMVSQAIKNSLEKYPKGETITPEMIEELNNELMKRIIPWVLHNNKD